LSNKKKSNGDHLELVTRFFAYLSDLDDYDGRVLQFLERFLGRAASRNELDISRDKAAFDKVMNFVNEHFPMGFRRLETSKTTPRARFEAIAVGVAMALQEEPTLSEPVIPVSSWIFSEEFQLVVSADSANNKAQLLGRIKYVKDKILGE